MVLYRIEIVMISILEPWAGIHFRSMPKILRKTGKTKMLRSTL